MFSFVVGDLLDPEMDFTDICHGVNLSGVMGAGIAKSIRELYGEEFYEDYKHWCLNENPSLGDYLVGHMEGLPFLWNLATQPTPGPTADIDAVVKAFDGMLESISIESDYAHIGVPQIGCGIGGLQWKEVLPRLIGVAMKEEYLKLDITFVSYKKDN